MSKKLDTKDLVEAREKVKKIMETANPGFEIAKTIGEPYDPTVPYPEIVNRILATDTAGVGEDIYTFDVDEDTKEVYILSNGIITSMKVTPNTPNQLTFSDIATKEYYITVSDLLKGKYDVLARKRVTIERSLDALEIYEVVNAIATAVPAENKFTGSSFTWQDAVNMVDVVENYGGNYLLICGSTIGKDITLMNYKADKNAKYTLEELDIEKVVVRGKVKKDNITYDLIDSDTCYLVALADARGKKPGYFIRRELQGLDGAVQNRVVLPSSPVMAIGSNRVLAFGEIGYEQIGLVLTNAKVLAEFKKVSA